MKEPSILDYLKSRLNPWQKEKIQIPKAADMENPAVGTVVIDTELSRESSPDISFENLSESAAGQQPVSALKNRSNFPWRTLLALFLGLFAQSMLEPGSNSIPVALGLYFFALMMLAWAALSGEFRLPTAQDVTQQVDPQTYHRNSLLIGLLLAAAAFLLFSENLFTLLNVSLWLAALAFFVRSLWLGSPEKPSIFKSSADFFKRESWQLSITRWGVLFLLVVAAIVFFRFYRLSGVPGEPFSDHAEKLLDVYDVTQGQTHIFFPRNTGREFIQFYLTAAIVYVLGTGISFISLKIGTALIGLFALPYVYLLGKEVSGKRVALIALILAGSSYWLNTISRIGLRFPLYPAFAAPTLYYLIRGLRRQERNDFILSGLFLGLGLHGYSPFRFVPVVILLGVGVYLLHRQSQGNRKQTVMFFSILVLASFLVFLPLMRYAIENPDMFSYRAMSRLTGDESPLPGPAWQIFASNTFRALTMFNFDDGEIWVHSIPHRPALDIVDGALFIFGYIFLIARYLRKRDWLDLYLLLAVPLFLMPSILSLAFPAENPSLNRTGAAAVVVFVLAAMALDGIYMAVRGANGARKNLAGALVTALLLLSAFQNYNLVFDKFSTQFLQGAWNTSEMGKVIRAFVEAGNSPDNAFVVPFPYWVDTRLVGIQAGYPTKDYALWRDDLPKSLSVSGSKLFIVKEEDKQTLEVLKQLYPAGMLGHFTNPLEGKNFWIFTVPDNLTVMP
jgi:hypothetical protein